MIRARELGTLIGCVIRPRQSEVFQALHCLQSLRWFGGSMAGADFAVCAEGPLDAEQQRALRCYGALVWSIPADCRAKRPAKAAWLEQAQAAGHDLALLLDANTLILRDPAPYLNGKTVQAGVADVAMVPATLMEQLAAHFEIALPAARILTMVDRQPVIAMFNAGVIAVPRSHLGRFVPAWEEYVRRIEAECGTLLEEFPLPAALVRRNLRYWLAYCMTLSAMQDDFEKFPLEINCPASYFLRTHLFDVDPVICRYAPEPEGKSPAGPIHHDYLRTQSRMQFALDRFNARLRLEWRQRPELAPPRAVQPPGSVAIQWSPPAPSGAAARRSPVRIMVGATPRTGNNWLTHLLSWIYQVPRIEVPDAAEELPPLGLPEFVFYKHFTPTNRVLEWGAQNNVTFITLVRHPADVFLSLYHLVNDLDHAGLGHGSISRPCYRKLIGQPLDSEPVRDFLVHDFEELENSLGWVLSGRALVVRYEALHEHTERTLLELTRRIAPVDPARIRSAIDECTKDKMRRQSAFLRVNVRSGLVGEGAQRLPPQHLELIRRRYRDLFPVLGYTV